MLESTYNMNNSIDLDFERELNSDWSEQLSLYPHIGHSNTLAESETETEPEPIIPPTDQECYPCYPSTHEWFIKITSSLGEIRYISSYHSRILPRTIADVFDNLILPTEDRPGVTWEIDREYLYDVNPLYKEDV